MIIHDSYRGFGLSNPFGPLLDKTEEALDTAKAAAKKKAEEEAQRAYDEKVWMAESVYEAAIPALRKAVRKRIDELAARRQAVEALRDALVGSQRIARIVRDLVAFGRSDARRDRVHLRDAVEAGIRWRKQSA